ncbi:hypothetical protein D3C76_946510 [compost metagenome]
MGDLAAEIPTVDLFEQPVARTVLTVHHALDALLGVGDDHTVLIIDVEIGT